MRTEAPDSRDLGLTRSRKSHRVRGYKYRKVERSPDWKLLALLSRALWFQNSRSQDDRPQVNRSLLSSSPSSSWFLIRRGIPISLNRCLMAPRFEEQGQLQLLEREEDEEDDCFEPIDKRKYLSARRLAFVFFCHRFASVSLLMNLFRVLISDHMLRSWC